jgi:hypothetical protein
MKAVVALKNIEAAFSDAPADFAGRIDAESLKAGTVSRHMGLANQNSPHASFTQMIAQGQFAHTQRRVVGR